MLLLLENVSRDELRCLIASAVIDAVSNPLKKSSTSDVSIIKGNEGEIDIDQASKLLSLEKGTIYNLIHAKKIPYLKKGGKVFFTAKNITEYLHSKAFGKNRKDTQVVKNEIKD